MCAVQRARALFARAVPAAAARHLCPQPSSAFVVPACSCRLLLPPAGVRLAPRPTSCPQRAAAFCPTHQLSAPWLPALRCSQVLLRRFPRSHPFAHMSGTENMIAFTTMRYRWAGGCTTLSSTCGRGSHNTKQFMWPGGSSREAGGDVATQRHSWWGRHGGSWGSKEQRVLRGLTVGCPKAHPCCAWAARPRCVSDLLSAACLADRRRSLHLPRLPSPPTPLPGTQQPALDSARPGRRPSGHSSRCVPRRPPKDRAACDSAAVPLSHTGSGVLGLAPLPAARRVTPTSARALFPACHLLPHPCPACLQACLET